MFSRDGRVGRAVRRPRASTGRAGARRSPGKNIRSVAPKGRSRARVTVVAIAHARAMPRDALDVARRPRRRPRVGWSSRVGFAVLATLALARSTRAVNATLCDLYGVLAACHARSSVTCASGSGCAWNGSRCALANTSAIVNLVTSSAALAVQASFACALASDCAAQALCERREPGCVVVQSAAAALYPSDVQLGGILVSRFRCQLFDTDATSCGSYSECGYDYGRRECVPSPNRTVSVMATCPIWGSSINQTEWVRILALPPPPPPPPPVSPAASLSARAALAASACGALIVAM